MAVAAYASLLSLTQVLNNVHNRAQLRNIHADINQIETLHELVDYLVGFIEVHHQSEDPTLKTLWRQISEVAFEAEEMFDWHVVNQLLEDRSAEEGDNKSDFLSLCEDMEGVIQKIDLIKTALPLVNEVGGDVNVPVGRQPKVVPKSVGGKNLMIGFDEHMLYIMDELTKDKGNLKTIPITGMGGIGKTTLARNVFENQCIVDHFDMKIWLTISQEYNVHEILTGLVNDGVVQRGSSGDLESLGHNLYQKLFGRRYLIVMDDMWDIEAWDDFKRFFPNNANGSRIMVTTRLENVANSLGSSSPYCISFLDEKRSWNLFCQTSFGQEDCPFPDLKEIGMKIAKSCRGLPLAITAIGGLLANSNKTKQFWVSIEENVSSLSKSEYYEHCIQILNLSYMNLPIHLKPCFLYLRSYPEDYEIEVPELIHRWTVEGFIKPADGETLEEIAMEYFQDLVSRSIIFIRQVGQIATQHCGVHDLFRDLCLRESDNQCFIRLPMVQSTSFNLSECFQCRGSSIYDKVSLMLHNFVLISELSSSSSSSSSSQVSRPVCGACEEMYSHLTKPRMVRMIREEYNDEDDTDSVHPTQSRYVIWHACYEANFIFPSLIDLLWNLQILRIDWTDSEVGLPNGIWKLPELRHLNIGAYLDGGAKLPNPEDNDVEGKDFFILKNLHTLSAIINLKLTKATSDRIPNLQTLNIKYKEEPEDIMSESANHYLCNLFQLQRLKSLSLEGYALECYVLESIVFPKSLKALSLLKCKFSWEDMSVIVGSLPSLEVLSVVQCGVGSEWTPVEGKFLQLRVLLFYDCDLVQWRANAIHFPKLEKLILRDLKLFEEIPLEIGDVETLQAIELSDVRKSVIYSAKQIWEEQQSVGNYILQCHVYKDHFTRMPIRDWNL